MLTTMRGVSKAALALIGTATLLASTSTVVLAADAPKSVLLFGKQGETYVEWWDWRSIDDRVMGGESFSTWTWDEEGAHFQGEVSSAEGSGFASVRFDDLNRAQWERYQVAASLECDAVVVIAAPTNRTFKVVLRTDDVPYGVYYTARMDNTRAEFTVGPDGLVAYAVPLAAFEARVQGKRWEGGPALGSYKHLRSVGFMVGDGQTGTFALHANSVLAVNLESHGWSAPPGTLPIEGGVQSALAADGAVVLTRVPTDAPAPRPPVDEAVLAARADIAKGPVDAEEALAAAAKAPRQLAEDEL